MLPGLASRVPTHESQAHCWWKHRVRRCRVVARDGLGRQLALATEAPHDHHHDNDGHHNHVDIHHHYEADHDYDHNGAADHVDDGSASPRGHHHVDDGNRSARRPSGPGRYPCGGRSHLHRLMRYRRGGRLEVSPAIAGLEFLDTEWFYEPAPPAPPTPEPWRSHRLASRCYLLPRGVLLRLAQPERLAQIARDHERLASVRRSLEEDGLHQPLELVIDTEGHIVLRDGHHRLLCSAGLRPFSTLPTFFTRSPGIGVPSSRAADLLEILIRSAEPVAP